jgi:hypothetical protein
MHRRNFAEYEKAVAAARAGGDIPDWSAPVPAAKSVPGAKAADAEPPLTVEQQVFMDMVKVPAAHRTTMQRHARWWAANAVTDGPEHALLGGGKRAASVATTGAVPGLLAALRAGAGTMFYASHQPAAARFVDLKMLPAMTDASAAQQERLPAARRISKEILADSRITAYITRPMVTGFVPMKFADALRKRMDRLEVPVSVLAIGADGNVESDAISNVAMLNEAMDVSEGAASARNTVMGVPTGHTIVTLPVERQTQVGRHATFVHQVFSVSGMRQMHEQGAAKFADVSKMAFVVFLGADAMALNETFFAYVGAALQACGTVPPLAAAEAPQDRFAQRLGIESGGDPASQNANMMRMILGGAC